MRLRVIENLKIAEDVHVLKIEKPPNFSPLPGQFAVLSPNGIKRAYSIANYPEHCDYLEFCIKRVPGGAVSPLLCDAKPGTEINLFGPFGKFVLQNPKEKRILFACTGTGIAPIKAMLEYLEKNDLHEGREIHLVYGARDEKSILYREYINSWMKRDNFHAYITLSAPSRAWKGERGLIQDVLRKHFSSLKKFEIYICGSPQMVRETKSLCEILRAKAEKIKYEACILKKNVNEFIHKLVERSRRIF